MIPVRKERGKHLKKPGGLHRHLRGKLRIEKDMHRKWKVGLIRREECAQVA